MANVLDYLAWRGDLPLAAVPLCDVDYLIFSGISYLPWDGVVDGDFSHSVPLGEAVERVHALAAEEGDGRHYHLDEDEQLTTLLAKSERFSSLALTGFRSAFNEARQEQFSAVTVLLPGGDAVTAFRGTDGTLVGWKEDFNMAFSDAVPAQLDAKAYVEAAAAAVPGGLHLAGHSKGGNLALYASAFCDPKVQARIKTVRNFDGPGFSDALMRKEDFAEIAERTHTVLPQSSIIGMLLEHAEEFSVVESKSVGILQHNFYMWQVARGGFSFTESRTSSSYFIDATLKEWVAEMDPALREKMINGAFTIFGNVDGTRVSDLRSGKNAAAVLKAIGGMDDETRAVLLEAFRRLQKAMASSLPEALRRALPPAVADLLLRA